MQSLIKNSQNILKLNKIKTKRFLFEKIDFSQKMIGVIGQRGVGKTTLMIQYLKTLKNQYNSIYFSADDIYFLENSLKSTVETLYYDYEIKIFCIDEIHKYKNWNQELKNIYDLLPDIKIIFSGSSSLDVVYGAYDLSRRAVLYQLPGLSFREFLNFKLKKNFQTISINQLFGRYKSISLKIATQTNILKLFKEYLRFGYYPYFLDGTGIIFDLKLSNAINKTIYEDIANLKNIKTKNLYLFKKILNFLASTTPGQINVHKLSLNLGVAFETIEEYIDILYKISFIRYLLKNKQGYKLIRKAEKIFLDNSNIALFLQNKLGLKNNFGSIRELFVLNQLQNSNNKVYAPKQNGDFMIKIDSKDIVLEVGGKSKDFSQIAKIKNSFLVLDDMEFGEKGKIPLWLFGFLY